jgi:hypothetical protein
MTRQALQQLMSLLCLMVMLLPGCSGTTPQAETPTGTRRIVWLDLSGSVTDAQRVA